MFHEKSRRIIIIKDIQSNLFEEAILVLKENSWKEKNDGNRFNEKKSGDKNDFILKEAETIINNYIRENKERINIPKKNIKKQNNKLLKDVIINSALIGSIAAVAFLILKMI